MSTFPSYRIWLGGRPSTDAMKRAYFAAKDAYTPSRPPGSGSSTAGSRGSFGRSGAFGATDPARDLRTPSVTAPPRRGSGVPWDGGGDHRGLATGHTDPVSSSGSRVPWDGGGDHRGLATGHTDPVKGKSSFGTASGGRKTGAFPESNKPGVKWRTPASKTPVSPSAATAVTAAEKAAEAVGKTPSRWSELGAAVGKVYRPVAKVLNTPAGKMAGKAFMAITGAKAAGDLWGAAEPYIDVARYGHQLPLKEGVGGRDNRLDDLIGNVAIFEKNSGDTRRALSSMTGGASDKFFDTVMPYRKPKAPAAAAQKENPAFKKPDGVGKPKTSAPAPQQPGSLREIGQQARGQSKAMRSPDDYLGSAFDATLRKGIDTGRNYLQNQMNKDGLDADTQQSIMERYNKKIAGDKELSKAANKGGIVNTIEAKDPGRGQRTLEAYRGQRGTYQGNTSYKAMQEKYVK